MVIAVAIALGAVVWSEDVIVVCDASVAKSDEVSSSPTLCVICVVNSLSWEEVTVEVDGPAVFAAAAIRSIPVCSVGCTVLVVSALVRGAIDQSFESVEIYKSPEVLTVLKVEASGRVVEFSVSEDIFRASDVVDCFSVESEVEIATLGVSVGVEMELAVGIEDSGDETASEIVLDVFVISESVD